MRRVKKGAEEGAKLVTALLLVVNLLVMFFAASFIFRMVHELPQPKEEPLPKGMRVEVLNGSRHDRMARKVAVLLRREGVDVVNIDNAKSNDFPKTVVVDRVSNDMRYAKAVAKRIGCGEVMAEPDPSLYLEVSIIIGNDCAKLFPKAMEEQWW